MKTYEMHCLAASIILTLGMFCVFIFGCIWLDKAYFVGDMIQRSELKSKKQFDLLQNHVDMLNGDLAMFHSAIMPACYVGQKTK